MFDLLFNINNIMYTFPLPGWGTETYSMSYLEFWVTIFNLLSVIAFRKNHISAYPLSIIACTGLTVLFYQINLYSEQILNIYYVVISIIGWVWWLQKDSRGSEKYPIKYMGVKKNVAMVIVMIAAVYGLGTYINEIFSTMATFVAGLLGQEYTHYPAELPYWDAFTTITAFFAMYLLTKRYVESWVLWTLVNIVSIGLYYYRGVIFLSVEYVVFLANSIFAWYQWHKHSRGLNEL